MEHWKKLINPEFLGAYSLDDGNGKYMSKDGIVTHVIGKQIDTERGKESKLIAYTNMGKPFILNAGNRNVLIGYSGSNYPEMWKNIPVNFYVEIGCRNPKGGKTDGLRIRAKSRPVIDYSKQTACLRTSKNLDELKENFLSLTPVEQTALVHIKDEMKTKLTVKTEK